MRIRFRRLGPRLTAVLLFWGIVGSGPGWADDTLLMVVNGVPIVDSDIDTALRINFGPKYSELTPEDQQTIRITRGTRARSHVLDRILLTTAAEATGQKVSESDINKKADELEGQFSEGMTLAGYLKGTGLTTEAFRKYSKDQALIDKLSVFKTRHIKPRSKAQIEAYYRLNPDNFKRPERADVRHILISTGDAVSDEQRAEKRAQAEIVRRKLIAAGPDQFGAIAKEHSHCPSKAQAGDLGMIEKGAMVPAFDRAVFSQKVGAIGSVIRTQKGYHIIQVKERFPAENLTLIDAQNDINTLLDYKARNEVMQNYLKQLRLSATVEKPKPEPAAPRKKQP